MELEPAEFEALHMLNLAEVDKLDKNNQMLRQLRRSVVY